jgi:hypothetical protein
MTELGKILMVCGGMMLVVGVLLTLSGKIPWLGRLPGDIIIQRDNFSFYFPLTTCLLLSVVLSLIVWFLRR